MSSFFLANPKNWWVISDLVRKEIGPLLPFNDLFLIPSSAAPPVEKNLLLQADPIPRFWCGTPEIKPFMSTIRIPIGEGDYLWLELILEGVLPEEARLQAFPFLTKVLQLLLEKAFLLSVQKKDPFTGLLNRDYFFRLVREKLTGASRQGKLFPHHLHLKPFEHEPGSRFSLGLVTFQPFDRHGAEPIGASLQERLTFWVKKISPALESAFPWPGEVGRTATECFSILWEGVDEATLRARVEILKEVLRVANLDLEKIYGPASLDVRGGFAVFPDHFTTAESSRLADPDPLIEGRPLIQRKADQARELAETLEPETFCSFSDIIRSGGKVLEVLPMNRVRINLGAYHQAQAPLFFGILEGDQEIEACKAIVSLNEAYAENSLAEICWIRDPLKKVVVGDRLVRLDEIPSLDGHDPEPELPNGDLPVSLGDQGLLTLPDFLRAFHQGHSTWSLFWMALLQIQDWELKGDLLGRVERQLLFQQVTQLIKTQNPAPELLARYSPDTLVLVQLLEPLPSALPRLQSLQDEVRERLNLGLTIGAAGFPQADYAKTDILDNALKALDHALLLGPGRMAVFDDTSLNINGDRLFDQGKIVAALSEYRKGLGLNPDNNNLRNSLGVCFGEQGNLEAAIQEFETAVRKDPRDFMGHYNLGLSYLRRQESERARQYLEKAGELDPRHFGAHYQLGRLYRDAGLLDQALPCFLQAARLHPDKAFIHRYLGECWVKKGDWDNALSAFKAAVRVNPRDAYSLHQLGTLYLVRESNLPIALSFCRYSVELEKGNPHFRFWLGRALYQNGQYEEARQELETAWELGERTAPLCFFLGLSLEKLEQIVPAGRWWEKALSFDPGLEEARQKLRASAAALSGTSWAEEVDRDG
jgi:tetratricopeptide (TPR) repeat protein